MMRALFFLIFISNNSFSQIKDSHVPVRHINKTIKEVIYENHFIEDREIYKVEMQIKKFAKNTDELSNAYYCLADVLLKQANYSDAIFTFKKVDSLTILTGNADDRIMANIFLASIYNKLSLKKQSDECFAIAEKLVKKLNIPDATMQLVDQQSSFLEENLKWCEALPVKKSLVDYFENKKEERYRINLAIIYSQLAYIVLKCNSDIVQAKVYLKRYEDIFRYYTVDKDILRPQYYIDQGIISAEENDIEKSKYWFGLAYKTAVSGKLETLRLRCMEEQIRYGLLDNASKKAYFDKWLLKKENIKSHAKKVIAHEQQLLIEKEADRTGKNTLFIFIISIIVLLAVILYKRRRRIRLKKHFERIIENIRQEKEESRISETVVNQDSAQIILESESPLLNNSGSLEKKIMSEEKEKELLKKIEEFEKTQVFTDEKFTMGKFASVLESNAKYINYVLHKYKGHTFSDYLNELRIKFIVNKLIEKPEYLNYKISYLAKISGFTSHSRFTYIFKNVLNISPSEFISQLNRQNKNGL